MIFSFPPRWQRSLVVCMACVTVVAFQAPAAYASKDTVPDWMKSAIAQPGGSYSAETSAVVLLDDTTLTVGSDGRAVEHRRRVVRILRPSGRDEGIVELPYDKDTKILSLHVWSVGPDGHEYAMKDNEIADEGYYGSNEMYSDERFRLAKAPGRDPGGVVAYEYDQRQPPYEHEASWRFQGDIPSVNESFTLEMPTNYSFVAVWAHHEAVKAIDLEHQRDRWEMKAVPAIDLDRVPLHPAGSALAGRMTVHFGPVDSSGAPMGSWQEIGEWFDGLSRDRLVATPDIAAKAAELTAGKTDFYDKAEAIGEFVQKRVRYFAVELGVGGYQPHPAGDVFRNLYGDCKDKATLLSAMLSSVGIHSAIMIVDTRRGVIDPASPAMIANHAIGAIEIPKGYDSPKLRSVFTTKSGRRYLIFDPTWEKTAFGQLEHNLQGSYGMLMEGKQTEIVEMPLLSPELNTVKRSAQFQLQADGTLKGSIVEKRFGDLSEFTRGLYSSGDAKEQTTVLNRRLSEDFAAFSVSDFKIENIESLNKDLTTTFNLSADQFARATGPLLMLRPRVMGSEGPSIDRKPRLVPIDLNQTMMANDDFTIELPPGYAVDELPDPVKLDLGFAAYESTTSVEGNLLHYKRTYTVRQVLLPADRYPDVQRLAQTIGADEQSKAILKKK